MVLLQWDLCLGTMKRRVLRLISSLALSVRRCVGSLRLLLRSMRRAPATKPAAIGHGGLFVVEACRCYRGRKLQADEYECESGVSSVDSGDGQRRVEMMIAARGKCRLTQTVLMFVGGMGLRTS